MREYLENVGESVIAPRVNCDEGDDYSAIWRKAFDDLQFTVQRRSIGFAAQIEEVVHTANDMLGASDPITPHEVRRLLEQLGAHAVLVVIIDEFDRVADRVGTQFADTIKMLSDQSVPATLVLVGVGQSVRSLIVQHESIERALAQVRMPRMSITELQQIVDGGLAEVGMTAATDARDRIAVLSQGLPHYTHLVALYAARHANDAESLVVRGRMSPQESVRRWPMFKRPGASRPVMSARADSLYRQVALLRAHEHRRVGLLHRRVSSSRWPPSWASRTRFPRSRNT